MMRNMRASTYGRQSKASDKSIAEQLEAGHDLIREQGWSNAGDYQDGRSASRFGTRQRGDWQRLLEDVVAGKLDVLILWESSRGDRTLSSWSKFLEDCRLHGVRIYVITHERLYDFKNARDWKTLAEDGISNAYESELTSVRARRGQLGGAKKGNSPGGPVPYGYRKLFDPETGKRKGQEIYELQAAQVRRLFDFLYQHVTVRATAIRLNATETEGINWTPKRVRTLAQNPAYVGLRAHKGITYKAVWEPIVDAEIFWSVHRMLNQPGRRKPRAGSQRHLLSYLALCECGAYMDWGRNKYRCHEGGHVTTNADFLEEVVESVVLARLKKPDALRILAAQDDTEAKNLESEVLSLKARLEEFRSKAILGLVSIETLNLAETELTNRISHLEKRIREQHVPPALRDMLDPDADVETQWKNATLIARRAIIKSLCEIRVSKGVGMTGRPPDAVMRERAFKRLRKSRWIGDELTWGEHLEAGQN